MAAGSVLVSTRPSLDVVARTDVRAQAAAPAGQDVPTERVSISDDSRTQQAQIDNQDDNTALLRQLQLAPTSRPEDGLVVAQRVRAEALVSTPPITPQDMAVAAAAEQMASDARAELARRALEQYQRNAAYYA
jgi:hypothetical protein